MPLLFSKKFLRNFLGLTAIMLLCSLGLGYLLIKSTEALDRSDSWVVHSYQVITETRSLSMLSESMLANQRGFLLSRDNSMLAQYDEAKREFSDRLAHLTELVADNPSQISRLGELRDKFTTFTTNLENRAVAIKSGGAARNLRGTIETNDSINREIARLSEAVMQEESELLRERVRKVEETKDYYFNMFVAGGIVSLILLLVFNVILLNTQTERDMAERSLEEAQERLKLALRGSSDGIFDWDLRTGEYYWSHEYKSMLGYNDDELKPTRDVFNSLLHPEDYKLFWDHYERYINGRKSEFICVFRMRHKTGRWVWINARGKALFDQNNIATRFIGAHTDVSHLKEYEIKLQQSIERAEKANKAKSDFLAHMSHEIRTPLTAISGIAEIFERNMDNLNTKQKQLVKTLNNSTFSLRELINDILDFSKIESGELELEEKPFSLQELFEQVHSIMALKANEKGLDFNFDYKDWAATKFIGDSKRLRQILINLVGNAVKFTEAGNVTVKTTKETVNGIPHLRIDVVDSGIGIPAESLGIVFERFKQGDASVSRKYGGSGLGLPISKSLVGLMGGRISVESESGQGSTFTVLLPFKTDGSAVAGTQAQNVVDGLNDKIRAQLNTGSRLLVVEDYEGNIVVLSYILDELGCAYDIAKTGVEALAKWQKRPYDIILMDIQMPEMDGFTATAHIRRSEEENNLPHTPIIGMTAHALVGDRDKCIEAGMDAYLPKPIVEADLKAEILKYLNQSKVAKSA